jgi:aryl-alcohol dehydrogenase-like predicted oxidoreductase
MRTTQLGRTGVGVSVAGLGCGGHSRLGMRDGATAEQAAHVVRRALDLGITLIDTAEAYGTEEAVGLGIAGRRDEVFVSTKAFIVKRNGSLAGPPDLRSKLEASLQRLGTDHVDVYHFHGIVPSQYAHVRDVLLPEMFRLRDEGKIRFVGITEAFIPDPGHEMLSAAFYDPWDVVMVGFNVLNQSARERVLNQTQPNGIGTLCMFALRRALSQPDALREVVADLAATGHVDDGVLDLDDPLGFLVRDTDATSQIEACYRFCRWEPGIDVVLTGTGSAAHLEDNVRSLARPPLPADVTDRLRHIFARVDHLSGN